MSKVLSPAAQRHDALSRRQVLRGLGACIALPTLISAGPAFAKTARFTLLVLCESGQRSKVHPIGPL